MNLREPTDNNVVKISRPPDLLGVVPHMLGFRPSSSLVVICVHGGRQRTGLVMRMDLPGEDAYERCAREVVARAEHEHPDAVLLVLYADEPDAGDVLPRRQLVDAMTDRFSTSPVEVIDALLVRDGRWWSYTCQEPSCCPPAGTSLPDPMAGTAGHVAAEAALQGRAMLGSREDLEATVRGPAALQLVAVRQTFDRVGERLLAEWRDDGAEAARARTVAMVKTVFARYVAGEHDITDEEAARICLGLGDKLARDEVASLPVSEWGVWIALLIELARCTPDGVAAPICTTLAWVAYQYGDGALANVALDRALADEPRYRMALMLRDGLDRQVKPEAIRSIASAVRDALRC